RDISGFSDDLIAHGADRVLLADSPILEPYRLLSYTFVLAQACKTYHPDILLFGATRMGIELAPRLAARLKTGLSAHCIDLRLDSQGRLLQVVPGWGGGVVATILCPHQRPQMATVMPGVMKKLSPTKRSGECIMLPVKEDLQTFGPKVLEVHIEEPKEMPLEVADVVVAGGWGVGDRKGWALLEDLATLLCGAVGATRPPVDEGWVSESRMIGQSGKTVKPRLYIGVGISGMSHHVVGMDESDYIVAVNSDPGAAIFEVSDVAVVGDYRDILPPLIDEIRKRLPEGRVDTCEPPQ
ncbi:MAG: electron transfer flavoprotein subunit alpha/FixB family protein, partial [Deltaproteobacteria bacterium]|nr:electron transfer flavoprotein subunit alpha/FixB family protein [Deltaproteobacteria bacterium]